MVTDYIVKYKNFEESLAAGRLIETLYRFSICNMYMMYGADGRSHVRIYE